MFLSFVYREGEAASAAVGRNDDRLGDLLEIVAEPLKAPLPVGQGCLGVGLLEGRCKLEGEREGERMEEGISCGCVTDGGGLQTALAGRTGTIGRQCVATGGCEAMRTEMRQGGAPVRSGGGKSKG